MRLLSPDFSETRSNSIYYATEAHLTTIQLCCKELLGLPIASADLITSVQCPAGERCKCIMGIMCWWQHCIWTRSWIPVWGGISVSICCSFVLKRWHSPTFGSDLTTSWLAVILRETHARLQLYIRSLYRRARPSLSWRGHETCLPFKKRHQICHLCVQIWSLSPSEAEMVTLRKIGWTLSS